jgi:hypothetical protein
MSHGSVRAVAGSLHVNSPEVVALLFQMPRMLRSLGVATTQRPERCHGEIRGPVQWSETMSARGATAGAVDLFICTTTSRAYDTPDNRLLVAALRSIVDAASAFERGTVTALPGASADSVAELARHARRNSSLALRFLDHRALSGVRQGRPTRKEVARARAGKRARTYLPALAVLERADEAIGPLDVEGMADERTRQEHTTIADVLDVLDGRGHPVTLTARRGMIVGGSLTYVNPSHPLRPSRPGIRVGRIELEPGASTAEIELACSRTGL